MARFGQGNARLRVFLWLLQQSRIPQRQKASPLQKEIAKIAKQSSDAGFTIVPLRIFINEKGYAKIVIGIGKGKKEYDKRQTIKEREDRRDIDRMFKR